ncbi:MAG: flagellar export protein FliJ [Defluviitaleaceae bacterium]|nr:flagellar export protein FliJ [Defluviitaleaceae bacterium]
MAKFNFRLASVLSVREKVEDLKKNEFGKAIMILEQEKARLAQLEQTRMDCIESFREGLHNGVSPHDVKQHNLFLDRMKKLIQQQYVVIHLAEIQVEEKRAELVEAMKDRKALDVLKENDYEEFLNEEKQAEQKVIDEIVSYRGSKNRPT